MKLNKRRSGNTLNKGDHKTGFLSIGKAKMHMIYSFFVSVIVFSGMSGCASTGEQLSQIFNYSSQWGKIEEPSPQAKAFSHYISSMVYEREGDYDRAVEELELVPEYDPEAVTPTLRIIRNHLRRQDYDNALVMAERAVEQAPERANLWVILGEIYHQQGRYDDAVDTFQEAIALSPDNILGYGALVELQESINDLVAAIDIYERLIEMNPESAGLYYQLAINYIRIEDSEAAQETLHKALELNPHLSRARFLLGTLYLEADDNLKSVAQLEHYVRTRPDDLQALENLAGALTRLGDYERALAQYERLFVSENAEMNHYLHAMYIHLRAGQPNEVLEIHAPREAPILTALFRAIALEATDQPYRPLLENLDKIEAPVEEEVTGYLNRLLYLFHYDQAGKWLLEQVHRYHEEMEQSKTLADLEGRIYLAGEDFEKAARAFEDALAQFGPSVQYHYYLASCYEELDDFEQTEKHLKAYLELDPDDPEILNFLGYLYADHDVHLDEAQEMLERALKQDPNNGFYLDSLGWVHYRMGHAELAIDLIQRAIYNLDSDDALLREHLGDAYLLKGDVDRAIAEWERAHRLDPKLESVQEKLEEYKTEEAEEQ